MAFWLLVITPVRANTARCYLLALALLRGLSYPFYITERVLLSCYALPSTLCWSSAIPPPAFSECVLYFSWRAVVKILNERFLLITQACRPIKQIDIALLIVLEPSAAVCVLCPTLHCFLFTFQNTCLVLCMLHKNKITAWLRKYAKYFCLLDIALECMRGEREEEASLFHSESI